MSYDLIKDNYNSELLTMAVVTPHQCKFTTSEYVSYGQITLTANINIGDTTGDEISFSGGDATKFTQTSYVSVDDEVIRVSITTPPTKIEIIARAQFGTVAAAHASGASAQIKHSGEVDNTCFGYPETCSDPNAYEEGYSQDLIFPSQTITDDLQAWSGLQSVKYTDTSIDPGETMGKRGKVSIDIIDSVDDSGSWDWYTVPYADRRTKLGTRFKKLLARSKWLENRKLIVYSGFKTNPIDFNNFVRRQYIIDDVQIDKNDVVKIKALDPLILTEDKKSKAPVESIGKLASVINSSSATFQVKDCPNFYYGALNDDVYLRMGSEVLSCKVTGALDFSITSRGFKQPDAVVEDHEIDETVQLVIAYESVHAVDIIVDLISNHTRTPADLIGNYTAIKALIPTVICTAYLSKPKSVKDLINELIKVADLSLWFDQATGKIAMNVTPEYEAEPIEFNEASNIEIDTLTFKRNLDVQYTRAPVYWAPVDITEDSGEDNFAIGINVINVGVELDSGLGDANEKKPFYCRWLENNLNQNQIGSSISNRMISRANNPPIDIEFNVDASDVGNLSSGQVAQLGSIVNVSSREILNVDGSPKSDVYQILSINELDGIKYKIKARLWQLPVDTNEFDFIIDESKEDYDLSTEFAPTTAGNYNIYISPNVVIGQVNGAFAMTTGAQTAGVELTIINRGKILAKGAHGANGFLFQPSFNPPNYGINGLNGFNGGNCLSITVPVTIDTGSGFIFSGGGSSGIGATAWPLRSNGIRDVIVGTGSSAGSGYLPVSGGSKMTMKIVNGTVYDGIEGGDSTQNSPGSAAGISGGEIGSNADDGVDYYISNQYNTLDLKGGKGGLAGYAITSNGNRVTITSGDTALNIKGRRQ